MKHFVGFKSRLLLLISLGIMIIFSNSSFLGIFVNADDLNPGVYSKDSKPFGIPYEYWLVKHTQWLIQIPSDVHPMNHFTSERCSTSQSGPVWYLTLNLVGKEQRTCTIPSDKAILLPILAGFCWDNTLDIESMTEQELTTCAMEGNEYSVISAFVDGKEIKDLKSYRAQSPFFNITVPENNIFDFKPGFGKGKVDGFFLFLEPLPPGNHTLHTTTSVFNPISPEYNYAATLTYTLIVKP